MKTTHPLTFFTGLMLLFLITGCGDEPQKPKADINDWFDSQYEEYLQLHPMELTTQGRKAHYDKLDDLSLEGMLEELAWREQSVTALKETFDYETLNEVDKVSYDLWVKELEQQKAAVTYEKFNYVYNQMRGFHAQLPNFLINLHRVDSLSDMQAYISRIKEIGRALNQLTDRAQNQADAGILPPRFALEIVLKQSKDLINGQPFSKGENIAIWTDALSKIDQLVASGKIDASEADALKADAEKALQENFKPAYDRLIVWLEKYIPEAEEKPTGVSRHPGGEDFYAHRLQQMTTTNLTADEIHNIGLKEVARIQSEMESIKEKVGFKGSLQDFFAFVNKDSQFYYPNTDEGRQTYLDESEKFLAEIEQKLPDYFGILPKADLVVKRVEAFREQDGAPAHYRQGTPDGSRPGTYYIHLLNMQSLNTSNLEGIAYHEGNPGHHMQISIAQELTGIPKFRTQGGFTAYVEGWALYSELLAKEMGQYENPYSDFGRLTNEIWRAIRLVLDTGLHAKGWTEADAIKYFSENSPVPIGAITAEVQRYMVIPGQATGYKIGMLKILELRQKAKDALGDSFDIKGFHDTVLGGGALPLDILEQLVDKWIADKKAG
ncbi:MAG: DUF885 domain-containing protein [Flavobacteriaceae bacterium]|nr:DUF885 domain-containing protein [Flavobacteriaceae bacterium]